MLSSGDADKHTLAKFDAWRSTSDSHENAFQQVDAVWASIATLDHLKSYAKLPVATKESSHKQVLSAVSSWFAGLIQQPYALAGASTAFILTLACVFWALPSPQPQAPAFTKNHYQTKHAEIRQLELADGSHITLAPNSELMTHFTQKRREVRLINGEGLFDVHKNPNRPFIVITGETETRVVGTIFSVKRSAKEVSVAVKEGKVRVAGIHKEKDFRLLSPGEGLKATTQGNLGSIQAVNMSAVGSWADGRLSYNDATLKEIVTDANRYYNRRIILGSAETGALRLAISFSTDNIEEMLNNLPQLLPISLNRDRQGVVILTKNKE